MGSCKLKINVLLFPAVFYKEVQGMQGLSLNVFISLVSFCCSHPFADGLVRGEMYLNYSIETNVPCDYNICVQLKDIMVRDISIGRPAITCCCPDCNSTGYFAVFLNTNAGMRAWYCECT